MVAAAPDSPARGAAPGIRSGGSLSSRSVRLREGGRPADDPAYEHRGVQLAHEEASPIQQVARRLVIATVILGLTNFTLLDAAYYSTVSLSTTGYGDIVPVTDGARLFNFAVITPLRVLFLIVLIGTTLEALTTRTREEFRIRRWRSSLRQHVVVCGYGTKGRSAVKSLQANGTTPDRIVVVDPDPRAIDEANSLGLTGIVGDAGRTDLLRRASVERARAVIVASNRDDASVLITLTVRQINPSVPITTSVREEENAQLLRQSGANTVITTSATAGRLLGLSTDSPKVVNVVEDLVTGGQGLDLHQRTATAGEVGLSPRQLRDVVLSVTRGGRTLRFDDPLIGTLQPEDVLVVVRSH